MEDISGRLQQEIAVRAQSYVPEWQLDMENPDIGAALALAYARMMAGTANRFARLPEKYKTAFLNQLDASVLPASPSHGYVQFALVNGEAEGAEVPAGTEVSAEDAGHPDGRVAFETREDIFVTPAVLSDVYLACDRYDMISQCYDRREGEWSPFRLFAPGAGNLQRHEIYFSHSLLLDIQAEAWISAVWLTPEGGGLPAAYRGALGERENAVFEYYSEEGWTEFAGMEAGEREFTFHKGREQPGFVGTDISGATGCWIRCRVHRFAAVAGMLLKGIMLRTWNREMPPDTVFGAQAECSIQRCFPFGERLSLHQEVYFGSQEVLSKKGAQITLSFVLDFARIPSAPGLEKTVQWEWVMKQSDLEQEAEADVTIEAVIWEYFNGSGWTRLLEESDYEGIFSPVRGGGRRTIRFICPDNIERMLVNAADTYYIRARITRLDNLYRPNRYFMVPILENTALCYRYDGKGQWAQQYVLQNNGQYSLLAGGGSFRPFIQTGFGGMGAYFGFEAPLAGIPVKILFCIGNEENRSRNRLGWEYWDGAQWEQLSLVDETEHFSRTGLVTFIGNQEMARQRLFGRDRYWIRVCDLNGAYTGDGVPPALLPVLRRVCINTTTVQSFYRRQREFFQMEAYREGKSFQMSERNIYEAQVYVDEREHLTEEELGELLEERTVLLERDGQLHDVENIREFGAATRAWVQWSRVADFSQSEFEDRHFRLLETEGRVVFGDGVHGKVPYSSWRENILVDYRCGGGMDTNLEEGRVDRMGIHIGDIRRVTNPCAMTGGCDAESVDEAGRRLCASIRNQGRAVSARDYEELARCAVRQLLMVKCFAGCGSRGERLPGAVTLVVLPEQFLQGRGSFHTLRESILQYMKGRIPLPLEEGHRLFVVLPDMVEVCLLMEVVVEDYSQVFRVRKEIKRRLQEFFLPAGLRRGGWEIGSFPKTVQIHNAVSGIRGIVRLGKIEMSAYAFGTGGQEVDVEAVRNRRYVLPAEGRHNIRITALGE